MSDKVTATCKSFGWVVLHKCCSWGEKWLRMAPKNPVVSSLPPGIMLWQRTRVSSPRNLAFHANYIPSLVNGHRKLRLNILTPITVHEYSLKILEAAYHVWSSNASRSYLFSTNSLIFWVVPFIFIASDNATKWARAFWVGKFFKALKFISKHCCRKCPAYITVFEWVQSLLCVALRRVGSRTGAFTCHAGVR